MKKKKDARNRWTMKKYLKKVYNYCLNPYKCVVYVQKAHITSTQKLLKITEM